MNMQPSEAELGFDLRLPPTADPELIKKRIDEEWAPTIKNMTYQVRTALLIYYLLLLCITIDIFLAEFLQMKF